MSDKWFDGAEGKGTEQAGEIGSPQDRYQFEEPRCPEERSAMTYRENMKPEQEFRDRHAKKLREAILGKSTVIDIRIIDDGLIRTVRSPAKGPIDGLDLGTLRILILAEACDPQGSNVAAAAYQNGFLQVHGCVKQNISSLHAHTMRQQLPQPYQEISLR
jgi:hypothetical protein